MSTETSATVTEHLSVLNIHLGSLLEHSDKQYDVPGLGNFTF